MADKIAVKDMISKAAIKEAKDYTGISFDYVDVKKNVLWFTITAQIQLQNRNLLCPPSHAYNFGRSNNEWYVTHDDNKKHVIATAPTFKQLLTKMELLKWPK